MIHLIKMVRLVKMYKVVEIVVYQDDKVLLRNVELDKMEQLV